MVPHLLEIVPEQCGIYCICNYSRHILNDNVYILRRNNKITHMLCNDLLRKLSEPCLIAVKPRFVRNETYCIL